jgi:hypothetical protein
MSGARARSLPGGRRARALAALGIRSCGAAQQAAARHGITRRTRPVPSCGDRTARQRSTADGKPGTRSARYYTTLAVLVERKPDAPPRLGKVVLAERGVEDELRCRAPPPEAVPVTGGCAEPEPIQDDEWLTQFVRRRRDGTPQIRTVPTAPETVRPVRCGRQPTANAMSVLRGRHTVEEATQAVCRRQASASDGVRYARALSFRANDFTVEPDPTSRIEEHSQVANLDITRPWTDDGSEECDASRFDRSFEEPIWWEGTT